MKLVSLFGVLALPLSAQTLFVPSGTSGIGSSSNGGIGVGTTNPAGKFHVSGDIRFGVGYGALSEVASNAATILGNNVIAGAGTNSVKRYFDDPGYGTYLKINNLGLTFHNVSAQTYATEVSYDTGELFRITNGGNVGIGTTSPYGRFEVVGAYADFSGGFAGTQAIAYVTSTSTGVQDAGATLVLRGRTGNAADYYPFAGFKGAKQTPAGDGDYRGYLGIFTQHASGAFYERMRVDGSGNVGIGSTSPNAKLTVVADLATGGGDATGFRLQTSVGPTGQVLFGGASSVGDYTYWQSYKEGASAGVRSFLLNPLGGNVGIGTTNPTQKLSVNGTIQAKEVVVQTGWSDYVFKPDYKLASLSEVEAHIKAHGYLPGVPSEAQVAKEGVSVGEMQSKLLAKLEEVTLHLISQEKRVQRLEKENAELRDKVSALSTTLP